MSLAAQFIEYVPITRLSGKCLNCREKVGHFHEITQVRMVACDHDQPWFPNATECLPYIPEDLDE